MSKQPTIAFGMIIKGTDDEAPLLRKALGSINGYVDAIYIDINAPKGKKHSKEVIAVAKQFGADYVLTEWTGNFVEARTNNWQRIPKTYDWYGWLDADDTVDKPEEIQRVIAIASKQQGIYAMYDYDHDEYGNCTVKHWVARLVRNNGAYQWKSSISDGGVAVHETLNEVVPRPKSMTNDFKVVHHAGEDRRQASLERNITLLEGMYDRQKSEGEVDPRTLFYLATHYYDAEKYGEAVNLLQTYLQVSGWNEERCEARLYLGNILRKVKRNAEAKQEYLMAIGEFQNSPRPYIELAELEYDDKRYEFSLGWVEKALKLPKPTTTMVMRPLESSYKAYMLAAQACVNIGGKKLDEAQKYVQKALKLRPLDDDAKRSQELIDQLLDQREDIRAAVRLVRTFEQNGQTERIVPLLNSLPDEVQDNPLILNTRHTFTEPKVWPKKSIALYVGQGPLGIWGPWSLEEGIGGSEEAVIRLSLELAQLGWAVTVFATPGERAGEHNKFGATRPGILGAEWNPVIWKQYYEFNPHDEYDVVIAWRNPQFFEANVKARRRYLWLHDLMDREEFFAERLENIDKVIFVGQYHADYYKGIIPEDKWFVSGNGIDPQDFIEADGKFKRTKHRMVYMSAHNRGLKILLDNWATIKKAVPDATLDIYYGWQSYDALNKDNPERMQWKAELVKQIEEADGVTDHGRIGQQQIVEEINKADVFAYPCVFPEVYCISYTKALAGGAYPVTSDYAEIGHYPGAHAHYEQGQLQSFITEYIDLLIKTLKKGVTDKQRNDLKQTARQKYSWRNTAEQWNDDLI